MNQGYVRSILACVLTVVALWPLHSSSEGRATDEKMAESALRSQVGGRPGDSSRESGLSAARQHNARLLAQQPDAELSATIVFSKGMSIDELVPLQLEPGAEIIEMIFKAPVGDTGEVLTVASGFTSLAEADGDFRQRAQSAMNALKGEFNTHIGFMDESDRSVHQSAIEAPWLVYKIQILGQVNYLASLQNRPHVAVLVIEENGYAREMYASMKADYEARRLNRDRPAPRSEPGSVND